MQFSAGKQSCNTESKAAQKGKLPPLSTDMEIRRRRRRMAGENQIITMDLGRVAQTG